MAIKHFAKKKWGQNFLVDTNLLKRIVRTIGPLPTDGVLRRPDSRACPPKARRRGLLVGG